MTDTETTPIYKRVNSSHGGYPNFYLNHNVGGWWATWTTDRWNGMFFETAHEELSPAEMREIASAMLAAADEIESRPEPVYVTTGKFQVGDTVVMDLDGYRDEAHHCKVLDVERRPEGYHWYTLSSWGSGGGSSYPHTESTLLLVRRVGEEDK